MGLRTADSLSSEIWAATEGLEVGAVVGVEQDFAWNVIKLETETPAGTRTLEVVRDELAAELLTAELVASARGDLEERGARVLELAASTDSLEAAAAQEAEAATQERNAALLAEGVPQEEIDTRAAISPLGHRSTGPFAMERPSPFAAMIQGGAGVEFPPEPADEVPGIGVSRELVASAFALTADAPLHGSLVQVDETKYLVRLTERVEALAEMPAEDFATIAGEIQGRFAGPVVGDENSLAGLWMNLPGPMPEFVSAIVEEGIESGEIKLRAGFFTVDAENTDPVEEI